MPRPATRQPRGTMPGDLGVAGSTAARFDVLGPLEVVGADGVGLPVGGSKQRALLPC